MAELSDFRIPTFVDVPQEQAIGDIYFNAIRISTDPIRTGSDEYFEVADNQIAGGGGGVAFIPPLGIFQVDDDNIGIKAGSVNNVSIDEQTDIQITTDTRVWIKITLDTNKDVSTAEVHVPDNNNILTSTSSIAYVNIGRVYYNNANSQITSVQSYSNGSIGYNYGGSDYHFVYRK